MALNEDDKKFITDAIKESQTSISKQESNARKKAQDEQMKYITSLQRKQSEGNLTLAQSVELLKHDLHETIEQNKALKVGQEAINKTIKAGKDLAEGGITSLKGANQMTSGLATLLLKSNPLTGMFVKNQSALGALSNVSDGFKNTIGGITKGTFNGIASLLGIKKDTKTKKEDKKLPNVAVNKLVAKEIISEKHRTKNLPVEDTSSPTMKIIKNGFNGLKKGFNTANELAKKASKNSKLLLFGLLSGVAAIAGIRWVLQHTNWGEKIKGAIQEAIPTIVNAVKNAALNLGSKAVNALGEGVDAAANFVMKKPVQQGNNATNNLINSISNGMLTADTELNNINSKLKSAEGNSFSLGKTKQFKNVNLPGNIDKLRKQGEFSKSTAELLKKYGNNFGLDSNKITGYNNTKGLVKLSFPVPVFIIDIKPSYEENGGVDVVFQKANPTLKEAAKLASPQIIVSNIVKLIVTTRNRRIPKNTTIGLLGPYGRIIGNIDDFMNGADFQEWENNEENALNGDTNFKNFYNQKGISEQMGREWNRLNDDLSKDNAIKDFLANPVKSSKQSIKMLQDAYNEHYAATEVTDDTNNKPSVKTTYVESPGDKQTKIENQSSKLNKPSEAPVTVKPAENTENNNNKQTTIASTSIPNNEEIIYSTRMDIQSHNNANAKSVDLQAVGH